MKNNHTSNNEHETVLLFDNHSTIFLYLSENSHAIYLSPIPEWMIFFSEWIWLSGKTLDCRPRDCEFDPPSLQLKLLKKEICTGSSQEKCSRISVLYTGHV